MNDGNMPWLKHKDRHTQTHTHAHKHTCMYAYPTEIDSVKGMYFYQAPRTSAPFTIPWPGKTNSS